MSPSKKHIFIARAGYGPLLREEIADTWGAEGALIGEDAVVFDERVTLPAMQSTVFARQYLPLASELPLEDLAKAAAAVVQRLEVAAQRPNRKAGHWTLHAFALDDNAATQTAARLEKAVLALAKTKAAATFRRFVPANEMVQRELAPADFVVQLYLPTAASAWLSVGGFSSGISPYVGGNLRMRHKTGAPSRSARKIEEAYIALGRFPKPGETAVDLGAAPGGWTFSLARRGATVTAVDAADLALPEGKKFAEHVKHVRDNGLRYHPEVPVDWLVCDMIVAPHETLKVLSYWLDKGWMQNFIVNLKLPKSEPWASIKDALALFEKTSWPVMKARHLYHDRWEVTLMGMRDPALAAQPKHPVPRRSAALAQGTQAHAP